jgi:hypothetical protein
VRFVAAKLWVQFVMPLAVLKTAPLCQVEPFQYRLAVASSIFNAVLAMLVPAPAFDEAVPLIVPVQLVP